MVLKTSNTFLRMIQFYWKDIFLRVHIKRKQLNRKRRRKDKVVQLQSYLMKRYLFMLTYLSNQMISIISSQFSRVWILQTKMQPSWWIKQGLHNLRTSLKLLLICLVRLLMCFCKSRDQCIKMLLSVSKKWRIFNSSLVIICKQSSFKQNVS